MIKIAVLTSSRADYGIYEPLLNLFAKDHEIDLSIVAFGMHLLEKYGLTIDQVKADAYGKVYEIEGMSLGDSPQAIAESYASVLSNFAQFWSNHVFDIVFALGDRYEMSAAVQASIPFNVQLAHIHGGETTLGAIDNIYRHQITLASSLHFTASDVFAKRVTSIIETGEPVHNVGALSLDGLDELELPQWSDVARKFDIPENPFVLVTVHPETVNLSRNERNAEELFKALGILCMEINLVITLTNADAGGNVYRQKAIELKREFSDRIFLVDNFGRLNYFAAMKASSFLLGNTSSGIIEAASMNKFVLNLGDRQAGRLQSKNIKDIPFEEDKILKSAYQLILEGEFRGLNVYFRPDTAENIVKITKNYVHA
ncbi:MAG: UDP-N-acetylglucosamine 2-epimerase, partial [Marinoscillum sp.]